MLQLPAPDEFRAAGNAPAPETWTLPVGVPLLVLAGVTDTWTLSVVPWKVGVCVVPVIAVVVLTGVVVVPAKAVPGVSKTPPATPPISTYPRCNACRTAACSLNEFVHGLALSARGLEPKFASYGRNAWGAC